MIVAKRLRRLRNDVVRLFSKPQEWILVLTGLKVGHVLPLLDKKRRL